jgi:putative transposase
MISFKGAHFVKDIILTCVTCVRWYLAYPLSYRHLEEMRQERGVAVDHSTALTTYWCRCHHQT